MADNKQLPWYQRVTPKKPSDQSDKTEIPKGVWEKCPACMQFLYHKELNNNLRVCPKCGYHLRISSEERFQMLFDEGGFKEIDTDIRSADPLEFVDHQAYADRLAKYQQSHGTTDAVRTAVGAVGGITCVVCAMEFGFMGGSMGSVVGEKVTRAIERCLELKTPLIIISASGGARMQESTLSLMQMGKTSLALARLDKARIPFISLMTDPTTGGTTASYAMLGDVNAAEPGALIGFAGPRVIRQTIRQDLPEGFQRSEFLLEKGMLDMIIERKNLKRLLTTMLRAFYNPEAIEEAAGR